MILESNIINPSKRNALTTRKYYMTNLQLLFNSAPSLGNIVATTSVWNFHEADHLDNLAKKKGTNINKAVEKMKKAGLKGGFTLYVYSIGRSGHSASSVAIISGITNPNECDFYYSKRLGEVFI